MRIGELARRSGIKKELIHYYLRRQYLHPPLSKKGNQAYYDKSHLDRLMFIKECKEMGTPLSYTVELWEKEASRMKSKSHRRMSGYQDSTTRQEIVEKASSVFLDKGYRNASISEIVSRVGITKPALYYYFRNKKDLYFACLDNIVQSFASNTLEQIKNETDPLKRIEMRGLAAMSLTSELITIFHLIKETLRHEEEQEQKRVTSILRQYWVDPLIKDIERGIEKGLFRPLESEIIGFVLFSILETYSYRVMIDSRYSDDHIAKEAFDFILKGLLENTVKTPS